MDRFPLLRDVDRDQSNLGHPWNSSTPPRPAHESVFAGTTQRCRFDSDLGGAASQLFLCVLTPLHDRRGSLTGKTPFVDKHLRCVTQCDKPYLFWRPAGERAPEVRLAKHVSVCGQVQEKTRVQGRLGPLGDFTGVQVQAAAG